MESRKNLERTNNSPKLYIMCGLPFAGKSYTGKKIAELVKGAFTSYDQLWKELDNSGEKNPSWERLTELAKEKIKESLKNGTSIVYDTLNDVVDQREALRDVAGEVDCEAITVYMNTPVDIINARRLKNEETKERHTVADETLEEYIGRFEPPVGEENVIEITPDTDLDTVPKVSVINSTSLYCIGQK